jgi:hypothetical protein
MKRSTDNWHTNPFLEWWEKTKREESHYQLNRQQLAFMAWLAAIDYYVEDVEEKYPSPTEEAGGAANLVSMDDLYDDDDRGFDDTAPMDWRY